MYNTIYFFRVQYTIFHCFDASAFTAGIKVGKKWKSRKRRRKNDNYFAQSWGVFGNFIVHK